MQVLDQTDHISRSELQGAGNKNRKGRVVTGQVLTTTATTTVGRRREAFCQAWQEEQGGGERTSSELRLSPCSHNFARHLGLAGTTGGSTRTGGSKRSHLKLGKLADPDT